jgi:hypothetical protein
LGILLFAPPWTFDFWQAWIYLFVFAISAALINMYLWKKDPKLIRAPSQCRSRRRKRKKPKTHSDARRRSVHRHIYSPLAGSSRTVAKANTVTFEGTVLQIPKTSPFRSHANKRIDVHGMLDGAVEFFYKNEKIATFDSKTTHALGLYRTNAKKEGFRYGPIFIQSTLHHELSS